MLMAEEQLTKTPTEVVTLPFNLRPSTGKGLRTGETTVGLTSVVATPATVPLLDIDQTTLVGDVIQARYANGLAGQNYHVTATFTTTIGGNPQTRQICGELLVQAC